MMIHREGHRPILFLLAVFSALFAAVYFIWPHVFWPQQVVLALGVVLLLFFLQFFRNPKRQAPAQLNANDLLAPADGKVVIIENTIESEYFKDERIQLSIFMSPLNVHVNRYPISGKVVLSKYHKGKFLVAWNPKSSLLNERTTVVVQATSGVQVLYRQIAGALARRIINYAKEGQLVKQGQDCGFIRFGSRVDLLLPPNTKVLVKIGEVVKGGETILAQLPK